MTGHRMPRRRSTLNRTIAAAATGGIVLGGLAVSVAFYPGTANATCAQGFTASNRS